MRKPQSSRKEMNMSENKMEEIYKTVEEIPAEVLDQITAGEGEQKGYTCKYCGKTFMTITSVACHVSSVHKR